MTCIALPIITTTTTRLTNMTFALVILAFYVCAVLIAFALAVCWVMKNEPVTHIPTTRTELLEFEAGIWYGYVDNKYVAKSEIKDEVKLKMKEFV